VVLWQNWNRRFAEVQNAAKQSAAPMRASGVVYWNARGLRPALGRLRPSDYFLSLFCLILSVAGATAQNKPENSQRGQPDDVVRINTELVQTDIMVFDKKGRFVDGLKAEQFALKIDDKAQAISFFEHVTSGSLAEERKARTSINTSSGNPPAATRGRILLFFVDDLHLAPGSLSRTRKALLQFIDRGMGQNDQVAITSSSGQIGFLQQFTDDKFALRTAVARLSYRANTKTDMEDPPMSEYVALKIREGDESAISFYVAEVLRQNSVKTTSGTIQMMTTESARALVLQRAHQIVAESAPDTNNTLAMLEGLMRTVGQLPGRKLVFLVSDGFYLNDRKTGSPDKIRRITDAAGRAGVIIYTLDARGIISEGLDATNNTAIDSEGLLNSSTIGEISASQDGLNALARDTGGRPFRNTNLPMSEWVDKVLDETSNYYLLAWRPDSEEQKRGKFKHIEVSIIDRPDLKVRLRGGYFRTSPLPLVASKKKPNKDPIKAHEDEMRVVIDASLPQREIPTKLEVSLAQIPSIGTKLTASIQIGRQALTFDPADGPQGADVDIGGIVYDEKGKPADSFVGLLKISPSYETLSSANVKDAIYSFQTWLGPGLYQVRVGVRDIKSGRLGSAMQWIEIPKDSAR
jgi:VWFA-related protein